MATEEVKFIFSMDDRFSEQAKKAESNVAGLENSLTKVGGLVAGAFSVSAVYNFGRAVVDSYGKMELFKTSLTTMLQGNVAEAEALNSQLVQLAKTTPFKLEEVQNASRQLIAYGSQAGEVTDELKTLGNVAAGIGAPIGDIAYLYGTIRTQGRAMTIDINQFANRGIPVWRELEKITGKTGIELRKFVEAGKVGFGEIQQVMSNLTKEGGQFFNLMENQSKTVAGQVSNLGDAWEQLKISIGDSQSGMIKSTLAWSTELINSLNEVISAENKLEKRLTKGGAESFGFFEKRGFFGLTGGQEKYESNLAMSSNWDSAIEKAAKEDSRTGNAENLNRLLGQTAKGISSVISRRKEMDPEDYKRTLAILEGVQTDIKGSIDLVKSKAEADKKKAETQTNKESAKVKQPHYTQIHININEMIHEYNVKTENSTQAPMITAEHVIRAMTQAVTDAQIVAGI